MGRAVRRHPLDRIRFSVASFQDNLVELRSGLPDCPSINAELRLERQSRLYTFTSPELGSFTGKSDRLVRPTFFTARYGVKTFGFRLLL